MTFKELQAQSRWLLQHSANVTSQCGEDGVLAKALELLPRNNWCIEFGAWDGRLYSNTFNLVDAHGYRGVFIEANPARFRDLQRTHDPRKHILINATVGFNGTDSLDALLYGENLPEDPDVLSIDIDGNDYYVWQAIQKFRPKIVVIEFNPTMSNAVIFVQEKLSDVNQGSSPAALIALARSKEYELIAAMDWNLIFVDAQYFHLFNIPDNSLAVMRDDSAVPHIFLGYDGHVFLQGGSFTIPWNRRVDLRERDLQVLPARLQTYPENYTLFQRKLLELWLWFRPKSY
jgi:hypothetical protein